MGIVLSKKKQYLLLLLIILVVSAIVTGILIFFKPLTDSKPQVDRYQDIVSWCDTKETDNTLDIDCKALLLNIRSLEDSSSCFDVQVITKDKQLKDISVCEKGDALSYTNEILEYKKLMPIEMVFTYTKEGVLEDYLFSSVSVTKLDDTYLQGVINEDIEDIMSMDKNATSILNSLDFCPKPEILPSYIEKKEQYAKYWEENILSEEEYSNGWNYSLDDTTIRLLFACDSSENVGYTNVCAKKTEIAKNLLSSVVSDLNTTPNWDKEMDDKEKILLKEISLIYDNMHLREEFVTLSGESVFNKLIEDINNYRVSEEVFCGINKIYRDIDDYKGLKYIENIVLSDITTVSSPFCSEIYKNTVDLDGIYLQIYFSSHTQDYKILNRCQNLTSFLTQNYEI